GIADSFLERSQGFAGAFIHDRDVAKDAFEELLGGSAVALRNACVAPQSRAIDCIDVPLSSSRRFGIGSQNVQSRSGEVRPVFYALRIAIPYGDDHDRCADHSIIRPGFPVLSNETSLSDSVDIILDRKRCNIGLKPPNDGARLRAAALVGF